ncbi:MAG: hypothetical protein OSA39_03060 [Sphingobium sp.]|nr:hypothetical protein [Sphingobium sp.]
MRYAVARLDGLFFPADIIGAQACNAQDDRYPPNRDNALSTAMTPLFSAMTLIIEHWLFSITLSANHNGRTAPMFRHQNVIFYC